MKPVHLVMVWSLISFAACGEALSPEAQIARQLVGTWTCNAKAGASDITSIATYTSDEKVSSTMMIEAGSISGPITTTFATTGSWKVMPDGRVRESVDTVEVKGAELNGRPSASNTAHLAPRMEGISTISEVQIAGSEMTVETNGAVVICTR